MREFLKESTEENFKLVEWQYECGLKAEKEQLPCYLPYEECEAKSIVGGFIQMQRAGRKAPKTSGQSQQNTCKCV